MRRLILSFGCLYSISATALAADDMVERIRSAEMAFPSYSLKASQFDLVVACVQNPQYSVETLRRDLDAASPETPIKTLINGEDFIANDMNRRGNILFVFVGDGQPHVRKTKNCLRAFPIAPSDHVLWPRPLRSEATFMNTPVGDQITTFVVEGGSASQIEISEYMRGVLSELPVHRRDAALP